MAICATQAQAGASWTGVVNPNSGLGVDPSMGAVSRTILVAPPETAVPESEPEHL
jgi:hypothetical protein